MPDKLPNHAIGFRTDAGDRSSGTSRALLVGLGRQLSTTQVLDGLTDVTLTTPSDGQLLKFNGTSGQWENITPNYLNPTNGYNKAEIDTKISTLVTGLEHYESVLSRSDTPPATPAVNDLYIVGTTPTGLWTGQANQLARWDGTAWRFEAPKTNESHLVEDVGETWHWNGTAWVKVAVASTGAPAAAGDLWMVGAIQQTLLDETQFVNAIPNGERGKWCLADGRNVAGTRYATLTGRTTVPDLRGAYLRMAGLNNSNGNWNGGALNGFQEDSTARPKNAFTGVTAAAGEHNHAPATGWNWHGLNNGGGNSNLEYNAGGGHPTAQEWTQNAGNHTHTLSVTGGGDAETKPKTYSVNFMIKVN